MKLKPVSVNPHNRVKLLCCKCGQWSQDYETHADAEGVPFKSYYCAKCVIEIRATTPEAIAC